MDINQFLQKWNETKQQISLLEQQLDKYKSIANKLMKEKNTMEIKTPTHTLKKRTQIKEYISKNDIPIQLWHQYKNKTSFDVFTLKTNNIKTK